MSSINFITLGLAKRYSKKAIESIESIIQGRSIVKTEINAENHLIITYDKPLPDGSKTQDAGLMPEDASFVKIITEPSKTWTIQHNLDTQFDELVIITTDVDRNFIIGEVDEIKSTNNLLVINFSESVAGKAIIKK